MTAINIRAVRIIDDFGPWCAVLGEWHAENRSELAGTLPIGPGTSYARFGRGNSEFKAAAVRLLFCMPCRDWCWLDEWMGGQEESVDEERRTGESESGGGRSKSVCFFCLCCEPCLSVSW